jgi:aminopeptidase YwaD
MKKIFILFFLLVSFNFVFGQNDIDQFRTNGITKQEILSHIKYLASDELEGRFPGTKGGQLAMDYISKEFKHYKLTPAGDSGYIQRMDMTIGLQLGELNKFSISNSSGETNYELNKDFIPIGFSSNGEVTGDVVFIGYGISAPDLKYDDYKDKNGNPIDVAGKILVMMRYSPSACDPMNNSFNKYEEIRFKSAMARDNKAAGIILITGFASDNSDDLIQLKFDIVPQTTGIPVINIKRSIIEKLFKDNGYDLKEIQSQIDKNKEPNNFALKNTTAKINVTLEQLKANTGNVIGYIEGNDANLKNEVILIGAHYDHLGRETSNSLYEGKDKKIHYGADDNASGTAGVMELAQILSAHKKLLKRSVIFMCFTGEEEGLIGSSYFVNSELFKKYNIVTMINMDMIGRLDSNKLIIYGTGTSSNFKNELEEINKKYDFKATLTPDGFGPSDQSSFYSKNIPVLFFFTGLHSDYHKPSDTYDKINSTGEEKVLKMVYDVALNLDTLSIKPDFTKVAVSSEEKKETGPIRVYVGTIPDFSSSEEGYKISGVSPGSPAEKGGIKAGDLMIKFGGREVKNIYDYTAALGEHKPGEEVEVVVLRNKEEITVKVTLGKR